MIPGRRSRLHPHLFILVIFAAVTVVPDTVLAGKQAFPWWAGCLNLRMDSHYLGFWHHASLVLWSTTLILALTVLPSSLLDFRRKGGFTAKSRLLFPLFLALLPLITTGIGMLADPSNLSLLAESLAPVGGGNPRDILANGLWADLFRGLAPQADLITTFNGLFAGLAIALTAVAAGLIWQNTPTAFVAACLAGLGALPLAHLGSDGPDMRFAVLGLLPVVAGLSIKHGHRWAWITLSLSIPMIALSLFAGNGFTWEPVSFERFPAAFGPFSAFLVLALAAGCVFAVKTRAYLALLAPFAGVAMVVLSGQTAWLVCAWMLLMVTVAGGIHGLSRLAGKPAGWVMAGWVLVILLPGWFDRAAQPSSIGQVEYRFLAEFVDQLEEEEAVLYLLGQQPQETSRFPATLARPQDPLCLRAAVDFPRDPANHGPQWLYAGPDSDTSTRSSHLTPDDWTFFRKIYRLEQLQTVSLWESDAHGRPLRHRTARLARLGPLRSTSAQGD